MGIMKTEVPLNKVIPNYEMIQCDNNELYF